MTVTQKMILMLFLKTAPQDLPYSTRLLVQVIFLYVITGMMVVSGVVEPPLALGRMVLNLAIILLFSYVLLSSLNLQARYLQTITALIGTGMIFNLLAWPVLIYDDSLKEQGSIVLVMLSVFGLIGWEILVTAHIFRHALNTKMIQSVLLSMALFFVSLTLSQLIFAESVS